MSGENSQGSRKRTRFLDVLDGSDEEAKERFRQRHGDLLKRIEENRIPQDTNEDRICRAKSDLRSHIGAGEEHQDSQNTVLFFIEIGPGSAGCRHITCKDRIEEGSHRIAVHPGMHNVYKNADYYHVRCFEDLADFSQAAFLDRIQPVTRSTAGMRGLKGTSVADGNYLLDGGSERLVLEWKSLMGELMDRRDGVPIKSLDPDFDELLHKAGSASYQPKRIDGVSNHEFFHLTVQLAPVESNGSDDQEEWNLFEQYISMTFDDVDDLNKPHSLSDMLTLWKAEKSLAWIDEEKLSDKGKELKEELGEKAIRAIKRLSSIPMPDFQSAFLGRLN